MCNQAAPGQTPHRALREFSELKNAPGWYYGDTGTIKFHGVDLHAPEGKDQLSAAEGVHELWRPNFGGGC